MKSLHRLVCLAIVLLAGCGRLTTPSTTSQAVEPSLLISVVYSGGLCMDDTGPNPCNVKTDILTDGTLTVRRYRELIKTTMLSADEIATLTTFINTTDFTAAKAVPFTGDCPTAYDGIEVFYTFVTAHGTEELASCRVKIDFTLPLFQTLSAILKKYE